jgi:HprK-related kinase B
MSDSEPTVAEFAGELVNRYPSRAHVDLLVHDCSIRVHANKDELIHALQAYYRDFIQPADAPQLTVFTIEAPPPTFPIPLAVSAPSEGKRRVKEESADLPDGRLLRKIRTDMHFLFGPVWSVAIGPCTGNLNQVINFVNNRFIQAKVDEGYLLCHAAGVARDGRGLLLAGLSGRGKSTLALHLLGRGLSYVSNDRLLVRRNAGEIEMLGLPKMPRVNPGTLLHNPRLLHTLTPELREQFAKLSAEELWELEHKLDVDVSAVFGQDCFRIRSVLAGAVILTWSRDRNRARVSAAELDKRRELLDAIIKPPGIHHFAVDEAGAPDCSREAYLACLRDCPVWEIAGGVDFDVAADHCVGLLMP